MQHQTKGTALITGASSGIGAAYARQLAAQGYDLILVARRLERLQALAAELQGRAPVCAEALAADLTNPKDVERVERRIASQDNLSLLVNNAGFGAVGGFVGLPLERHLEMIDLHVTATARLCHAALPGMIQRKRGAIVNVSSVAAFMASSPSYSATKAYLVVFSEALQNELKGTGVRVQALCPGLTRTEFHAAPEFHAEGEVGTAPAFMWMSAEDVVAASIRGLERGPVICIPGWGNQLWASLLRGPLAPVMIASMKPRPAHKS